MKELGGCEGVDKFDKKRNRRNPTGSGKASKQNLQFKV